MTTFTTEDRQAAEKEPLTVEDIYILADTVGFNVDGDAINDGIETAADFSNEIIRLVRAVEKVHGIS